jgi:hypothetical protein
MSYSLFWRSPALPYTGKQTAITVPAGSIVSNAASLLFTGKGASNYGKLQQENMMRLLENFAGNSAPDYPTVGQEWYDTTNNVLKVCTATAPSPVTWRTLNSTQVTDAIDGPPTPAALGDSWFSRTGSVSGILYTYTGIGRYPQKDWDPVAAGYYPDANFTTLAIFMNRSTFSTVNYGECYICGRTAGTPTDTDGTILVGSTVTTIPRGLLATSLPSANAFILWDEADNIGLGRRFYQVRIRQDGQWVVDDNNLNWVPFSLVTGQYVIGQITVAEQDDESAPGVTAAVVWADAQTISAMTQTALTVGDGAIGGWDQVWPPVLTYAGREEYNYLLSLLLQLIGEVNGAGAIDRYITYLPDMNALDASKQLAWKQATPVDRNVIAVTGAFSGLHVSPNSQDWDALLSACHYAIYRLDLPIGYGTAISTYPFVQDGLPAQTLLFSFPTNDPRLANGARKFTNPAGAIGLFQSYQSTVNALQAALANRYLLKGMIGTTGVSSFNDEVTVSSYIGYTANATGSVFTSPITTGVKYDFNYSNGDTPRFFYAGQAVELIAQHSPAGGPTVSDTNLKTLTDAMGRIRVTADQTLVMDTSSTPALAMEPIPLGYDDITTAGIVLATVTGLGGAQLTYRAALSTVERGSVLFYVDIIVAGATSGTFHVQWNWIGDGALDSLSARVYPAPLTSSIDKQGSSIFA